MGEMWEAGSGGDVLTGFRNICRISSQIFMMN